MGVLRVCISYIQFVRSDQPPMRSSIPEGDAFFLAYLIFSLQPQGRMGAIGLVPVFDAIVKAALRRNL